MSGLAWITCGEVSKPVAANPWAAWTVWVSLFAAFGFGTILAALISRWNSVSQLRQAWVDSLRSEIAEFFDAVERVAAVAMQTPPHADLRAKRDAAMFVYRKVLLRLNMREASHRILSRRLEALLLVSHAADLQRVDRALLASRRVLKYEWERTKYGPFLGLALSWKRRARRSRLRTSRRQRRHSRNA